jgi:sarcosine oxidase subunit alpha
MTQPYRTSSGGRIHRDRPIRFTFDGMPFVGFLGDTLASALLAHGVHLVGRSFKYHRPRGIMSAGPEEPNALVTIDKGDGRITPNPRATTVELYDGLIARSQNAWPSVRYDLGAVAGLLSPLLAAGFYYKTFMWPASFWRRLYEPAIRAAAGLGRPPVAPDPDRYLHRYAHCDVLVIGAGPTGLAAAAKATARGDRVILCDEQAEPGGSLLSRPDTRIDGLTTADWIAGTLDKRTTVLPRTTAFGWYPDNMIALAERVTDHLARPNVNLPRERLWLVRAKRVVIATGAIERPAVFPGNDRPGIMLAGAAATYLHRYGVLPGRRIVVSTSHDSAWSTAFALAAAGTTIAAILDQRDTIDPALLQLARTAGIPVHTAARIANTEGRRRVRFVRTDTGPPIIHCDTVLMSDGWTPSVHLFSQSRGKLRFDPGSGTFLPGSSAASEQSAGACAGTFDLSACLAEGHRAGGGEPRTFAVTGEPRFGAAVPPSPGRPHGKAFVDFQNDVTTKDLAIATSEGFRAIEHVKRYTTAGMATDQGKTANMNALATVAALTGQSIPEVGLTTFRPPYTPVTFGSFAGAARGDLFDPIRRTPIDDRDAMFEDVGNWKRAHYFPRPGETMHQAVARECRAVRTGLGLFDASTLGKIELVGPDAAEFLNRMYTGDFARLAPGRCKYGLLLGEDGFIRDDGVIARLAPDRFHVTTTTGGAASVLHQMEDYLQTEFPSLRVWLTSITEQWAAIALQGPRAADALAPFLDGIDLAATPHMSVREGQFAGVPTRLFRVSFTGELGFEINLPANFARSAWDMLRETGATRYGTETMHVLRAEKGFIVVGQETDGTVIPGDLGLSRTIARSKPDFVGKRSLTRPDMLKVDRKQLVGLLTDVLLDEGAQLTENGAVSLGHVTSAYHSVALNRPIALALLRGGRSRVGTKLHVPISGGAVDVTVTEPIFYNPTGSRMTQPITRSPARTGVVPDTEKQTTRPITPSPARTGNTIDAITAGQPRRLSPRLVATPFAPPPTLPCADMNLALAPATGKFSIRTQQPIAPTLRAATSDGRTALWLGPDEYLVLGAEAPGAADSIVDVSHRTVGLRIAGPRAAWCLNAFCALDLDTMPDNGCTRTLFGKAEIILWRRGETEFHIETARSYAPYIWALLEEARREFLPAPDAC